MSTKTNLFELDQAQKMLLEVIMDCEDSEREKELQELLSIVQTEMATKIDSYVYILRQIKAQKDFLEQQKTYFDSKIKSLGNKEKHLKDILFIVTKENGGKIQGQVHKAQIQKAKASLKILNENLIPEKYKKQVIVQEINKELLRQDLENGVINKPEICELVQTEYVRTY